ncbi:imidazoleglycerol-phosphate dehydratase HisB [Brevundimonas sp.]|uniref:imidazoleglycerol-phosphate dehydratase HisB n=1 Tax=Brevundimonas sp. TaxID=1871086 RepID=UPI0019B96090|nr:imidazoleglycerol-phosphate dehydratase HisB [Brevundimonas sp.]MBD3835164.1 imidazoleglycerol-phosphate dehydratase HisB [Brevundimonas sp.]
MTLPAPYPPLASGGDGLDRYPTAPQALAARMAAIYGAPIEQVLPVRGLTHGLELAYRLAARDGGSVEAPKAQPYDSLAAIYRTTGEAAVVVVRALGSPEAVAEMAARVAPALLVVDEGLIEFSGAASAVTVVADQPNLVVLRSLSLAYGLAGARVGAAVAQSETLARLSSVMEPYALPEPLIRLAMQALDPSRMIETTERIGAVRRERERVARGLGRQMTVEPGVGPIVMIRPDDPAAALSGLKTYGIEADLSGERLRLPVSIKPEVNDRLLAAFGLTPAKRRPARVGRAVRDTKETRIVCAVDLDAAGPIRIETGVGFFDHMLEQIAAHGGFSLRLQCEGDLHTDPHHTIEDSAIALGLALKQALGERKGIARYGFVLAMDEAEAHVALDLSGRPYPLFEGSFETPYIGEYRTDLTAHVFRSLAEAMGAAVHIKVTGQDDHHKTEAAYKGFGRALRQAIRIEGDTVPSTKGVL